jgi:hypothetical protein
LFVCSESTGELSGGLNVGFRQQKNAQTTQTHIIKKASSPHQNKHFATFTQFFVSFSADSGIGIASLFRRRNLFFSSVTKRVGKRILETHGESRILADIGLRNDLRDRDILDRAPTLNNIVM